MIVIAILGLLLPGYLLARALRSPFAWEIAFPLSVVLLTETVIVYTLVGIPLRFGYVLLALIAMSAICWHVWRRYSRPAIAAEQDSSSKFVSQNLAILVVVLLGLVLPGMVVRTTMYPLSGFDNSFRWDALARLMLKYERLSFFPPVTAEDYDKYTYPDGFPPLVSSVYWWLYAAWGKPFPAITSVAVILQAISCFALVFRAAAMFFGRTGGLVAVAALASATSFLVGVAIGQETGYTALSYAGQLTFTLAATRQTKSANCVVIAGIFAALGALAREYGPLLSLGGFAVLVCHRQTRRYLPLFCTVTAVLGGIWYIRNWVLTGNPLYPMDTGLGLPDNPVFAEIMAKYRDAIGLQQFSVAKWLATAVSVLLAAPLAMLVGIPCIFKIGRTGLALALAAAVAMLIWLWSIPYTSGGVDYSLRVLTPAFVALSISAGALGRFFYQAGKPRNLVLRAGAALAIVTCGGWAVINIWSHPFPPDKFIESVFSVRSDPLDTAIGDNYAAMQLEATQLPPTRLLTDSCYLAMVLQSHPRFHPVLIWSPEVAFVFDRQLDQAEVRRRLVAKGIQLISMTRQSVNNQYLFGIPFYRDEVWKSSLIPFENPSNAIFYLPADPKQAIPPSQPK